MSSRSFMEFKSVTDLVWYIEQCKITKLPVQYRCKVMLDYLAGECIGFETEEELNNPDLMYDDMDDVIFLSDNVMERYGRGEIPDNWQELFWGTIEEFKKENSNIIPFPGVTASMLIRSMNVERKPNDSKKEFDSPIDLF